MSQETHLPFIVLDPAPDGTQTHFLNPCLFALE